MPAIFNRIGSGWTDWAPIHSKETSSPNPSSVGYVNGKRHFDVALLVNMFELLESSEFFAIFSLAIRVLCLSFAQPALEFVGHSTLTTSVFEVCDKEGILR